MHVASWLPSVLRWPHFNAVGLNPRANHTVEARRAGSLSPGGNKMVFVMTRLSITVDRQPMLLVCAFCREPSLAMCAGRAPEILNEVLPHFFLKIAAATICHYPRFRRSLHITLVHSSDAFHRQSVNVEVNFVTLHLNQMNFAIKPFAFRRRLAVWPHLHTSPKNVISTFWRHLGA